MAEKMRHCCVCGKDIGVYAGWDRYDTCGELECDREVRHQLEYERAEAHEELDRNLGY